MRANVIFGKTGVAIGENAVIGACTLVNKDFPPTQQRSACNAESSRTEKKNERIGFHNYAVV